MSLVVELIQLVLRDSCDFELYPPREVVSDPSVLQSDEIAERLLGTKWWLSFDNGREELLPFPQTIVLLYNVVTMLAEREKVVGSLKAGEQAKVRLKASLPELLRPEVVRAILNKVRLQGFV